MRGLVRGDAQKTAFLKVRPFEYRLCRMNSCSRPGKRKSFGQQQVELMLARIQKFWKLPARYKLLPMRGQLTVSERPRSLEFADDFRFNYGYGSQPLLIKQTGHRRAFR